MNEMRTEGCARSLAIIFLSLGTTAGAAERVDPKERFESKIRPLLAHNCYACHTRTKLGGLQVDSREGLLKGGKSGPAIVPGEPDQSLLIQAVRYSHANLKMPPAGRLSDAELEQMEAWVREGAVWPDAGPKAAAAPTQGYVITPEQRAFWSYQPVRKPEAPPVKNAAWARGAIDRFILAKLEQRGLTPVREADRRTWIRRVTLDLTGLPPTPEEVAAFRDDPGADAYEKVVDRLLASPRYGERWARYWLDVARYSDDVLFGKTPNFYLYRDWVVRALNEDMPYDLFVKAHFAADLLPGQDTKKLLPALTMFVDAPTEFTEDDRVDVTTRGFLGMTVACAQCHDHKYDPIPTKDYYSLLGIFRSTQYREVPLAEPAVVDNFRIHQDAVDQQEREIKEFLATESRQLADVFAALSSRYLMAVWKVLGPSGQDAAAVANQDKLDAELLQRWVRYIRTPGKQHPFLRTWERLLQEGAPEERMRQESSAFQTLVAQVFREHHLVDEYNNVLKYGAKTGRELGDVVGRTMPRDRYMLWQELGADGNPRASDAVPDAREDGVLNFRGDKVLRFLPAAFRDHISAMRARLAELKREVPPPYPYLSVIEDSPKPANLRVFIRGNAQNLGEEAPRAFLSVLRDVAPEPFTKGSGRLQLAEAIASPRNPLTARVMVNRVWEHHFGYGLVRTPSNFGQTGDRPAHPELLDYLASRFVEQGWSLKKLHREIVLSSVYRLSGEMAKANYAADPDNRMHWRFARRRLDAEGLRDSLLFVSGTLDEKMGGPATPLDSPENRRRTVYGKISRNILDPMLTLFDFPNPNQHAEQRIPTTVPLQRLFLLNSPLIMQQGAALAARLDREHLVDPAKRIARVYELLFQRAPAAAEMEQGMAYVADGGESWSRYAQVLLASNEFLYGD